VLAACANELGLEAPGHGQAVSPLKPDTRARALDLTQEECDALAAYVQALPAPIQLDGPDDFAIGAGRASFEEIGCADCHRPSLGNIDGIYSDLLLHDMGPDLTSVTVEVYYGPPEKVDIPTAASMADGTEWRTPPLWGYRDSGPYLHDGRARNLVEAVRAHKGQASDSAERFLHSPHQRQSLIERFLKSLAAPAPAEPTVIADAEGHSERPGSLLRPPASPPPAPRSTALTRADAVTRAEQERIAASRLKLAESLEKMDKPQGALVFYREIIRDEPDTEAARIAAERIKALGGEVAARKGP
jgi:Di-haem oxidoreductase, putative peroxidase